jgi:hypothetical protein
MAKYPWGDAAFTMGSVTGNMVLMGALVGAILMYVGSEGALSGRFPEADELYGVALVSCAWIVMFYLFLGYQVLTKFMGESQEVIETVKYITDRTVINTSEQAYMFLMLLWIHAVLVNPHTSAVLGALYVAGRFCYPLAYGTFGGFTNLVEVPAQMGYAVITWLLLAVIYKCSLHKDLHSSLEDVAKPSLIVAAIAANCIVFLLLVIIPGPVHGIIVRGVKWEKSFKPPLASQ